MVYSRRKNTEKEAIPVKKLIDEARGGYVEIAVNNETGVIYVLYEEQAGVNCWLAAFDLDWILE